MPRAFGGVGIGGGLTAGILIAGVLVLGTGAIGFGALSDRIGRGWVLQRGVVGLFGLLVSLGFSLDSGTDVLFRNLPVLGIFALMTSALVPTILATVGDRANLERRGSAMGLYSVMLSGGSAVGTLLAGVAHSASGLSGIFEVAAAIFFVASAASLALWVRARVRGAKAG